MNLKLEVDRIVVEVVTLAGDRKRTTFFLPVPDRVTSPSTSLAAQLNDTAVGFLPCRIAEHTSLIRVEWIAYVELDPNQIDWSALDQAGAIAKAVEFELVTGERISGNLMVEGSEYAQRVSDYLNRAPKRFVLLSTDSAAIYVNQQAVARVRLEES